MNGSLSICPSCKHWNGMYCQHQGIGCGYEWEDKMPKTYNGNSDGSAPIFKISDIDLSKAKAIPLSEALKDVIPYYIGIEVPYDKLCTIDRLLTEAINLSYVSGDNTKAQMRDKIIEARRITEEIKRSK